MFYCEKCRKANGWPDAWSVSHGPCEVCGTVGECFDRLSGSLPDATPKDKQDLEADLAEARNTITGLRQAVQLNEEMLERWAPVVEAAKAILTAKPRRDECHGHHVQNCHDCDQFGCCDNIIISRLKQKASALNHAPPPEQTGAGEGSERCGTCRHWTSETIALIGQSGRCRCWGNAFCGYPRAETVPACSDHAPAPTPPAETVEPASPWALPLKANRNGEYGQWHVVDDDLFVVCDVGRDDGDERLATELAAACNAHPGLVESESNACIERDCYSDRIDGLVAARDKLAERVGELEGLHLTATTERDDSHVEADNLRARIADLETQLAQRGEVPECVGEWKSEAPSVRRDVYQAIHEALDRIEYPSHDVVDCLEYLATAPSAVAVGESVRAADAETIASAFNQCGGPSRHWVRECLEPALAEAGLAIGVPVVHYHIEILDSGTWTTDGLGLGNRFDSRERADEAIAVFRTYGRDWRDAEYRVEVLRDAQKYWSDLWHEEQNEAYFRAHIYPASQVTPVPVAEVRELVRAADQVHAYHGAPTALWNRLVDALTAPAIRKLADDDGEVSGG